jgi:hypothetical protein
MMLRVAILALCVAAVVAQMNPRPPMAAAAPKLWMANTINPPNDPDHKHCDDVTVDTSDPHAQDWLDANMYLYKNWEKGKLCDSHAFPSVESSEHPAGNPNVTLRKLGHGSVVSLTMVAAASKDCRTDKTSAPITISFTNGAKAASKIRGCQNQFACHPYQDCELALPVGQAENIVIDASFKYFVFTYHGQSVETELYPDANLKWPESYTIKEPKGQVIVLAEATPTVQATWFHEIDSATGDHKCRESNFTMGGISTKGRCPSEYSVFEKTESDLVCRTGGNLKYCKATDKVNVTINTWGMDGAWHHSIAGNQCFEANFTMAGLNLNGSCPSNYGLLEKSEFDKVCLTGGNLKYCLPHNIITVKENTRGVASVTELDVMEVDEVASASVLVINNVAPGGAHCMELSFQGGKNNDYYKSHGYQYQPPVWNQGLCAKKFNFFNRNQTIAPGVVMTTLGQHVRR